MARQAETDPIIVSFSTDRPVSELQDLLNTAQAGTEIVLSAGTLRLTETLTIDRSNITLRGQGDQTVLVMDPSLQASAIAVQKDIFVGQPEFSLAETAEVGTRTLVMTDPDHGLDVGSTVYIAQKNDDTWLASIESIEDKEIPEAGDQLREFHATVVARDGASLTLDRPLPYTFQSSSDAPEDNPAFVRPSAFLTNVGLSDFEIQFEASPTADDFANTLPEWERIPAIILNGTKDATVRAITITDAPTHAFKFQRSLDLVANDLTATGAHNKDGGNGYHFLLQELVGATLTGLSSTGARHAVLFSSYHAEHNNRLEIDFADRDINFHGSPDSRNTIVVADMVMDYGSFTAEQWSIVHASQAQKHPEPYEVLNTNEIVFSGRATGAGANDRIFGGAADNVFRGEGGDDSLRGNGGDDTLLGGDGEDVLFGGAGADAMNGGSGWDTVEYSDAPSGVYVDIGVLDRMRDDESHSSGDLLRGFEAVVGSNHADTLSGDNAANELFGGDASDVLNGRKGDDTIYGGRGDDTIEAGDGSDLLIGGRGNDDYTVRNLADRVVEIFDEGPADHVRAFVSFALPDQVELLSLAGEGAINGLGNQLDNVISGNDAANILVGYAGQDTLLGNAGQDSLDGSLGDDLLDGGAGADKMTGGDGSDRFFVNDAGDVVVESRSWQGQDTVVSSVDFRMKRSHIETLELTGDARIGAGNGLMNLIIGNDGDNLIDGGKNVDTLQGGLGNDTYILRTPGDRVIETEDGGIDVVRAYGSFALDAFVEKLFMQNVLSKAGTPVNFNGVGNGLDNTIVGTPFDNTLIGRTGKDTLKGQAGADTFVFDRALGDDNVDRIIDFNTNEAAEGDILKLKGSVFGGLAPGTLSDAVFVSGTVALDADDRIVFDAASGQLWFDADGSGAATAQLIATFEQNATVTSADIEVF